MLISRIVRSYTNEDNSQDIAETISQLSDEFTFSQNHNSKKGGLIGLAACAIALGNRVMLYICYYCISILIFQ